MNELIVDLLAFMANLRLAHWVAPTRTNEHRALGDLYETLDGLVDEFAEVCLGKSGERTFPAGDGEDDCGYSIGPMAPESVLESGLETISAIREGLTVGPDDDLLNLVADMSAAINRTRYLLQDV